MAVYLTEMFGISLVLTVVIELVLICILLRGRRAFFGRRDAEEPQTEPAQTGGTDVIEEKRSGAEGAPHAGRKYAGRNVHAEGEEKEATGWRLVVIVNLLTNPPAVLVCWLGGIFLPSIPQLLIQILAEIAVVAAEAWVYREYADYFGWKIKSPVRLSLVANGCSWMLGWFGMRLL
ncbi:MAG: hypothetical protein HFH85_04300 [Lachnospiraceae bacterium]|jgi:hypothetical protein|nr:hypothetical protein [Lachnospiraceae bacterium]